MSAGPCLASRARVSAQGHISSELAGPWACGTCGESSIPGAYMLHYSLAQCSSGEAGAASSPDMLGSTLQHLRRWGVVHWNLMEVINIA